MTELKIEKYIDGLYGTQTNLDVVELKKVSFEMVDIIKEVTNNIKIKNGIQNPHGNVPNTTQLFTEYNFLMYPFPVVHDLYCAISSAFHACFEDFYGKKFYQKHFIQCWLNIYDKNKFLDWHSHWRRESKSWHGFVCVDTEPNSYTTYAWPDDVTRKELLLDVHSKDGLIVMGLSNGDVHKSSEWTVEDRPRITIAFDIVPAIALSTNSVVNAIKHNSNSMFVNHWIPI